MEEVYANQLKLMNASDHSVTNLFVQPGIINYLERADSIEGKPAIA